jgi:hypothetical protein
VSTPTPDQQPQGDWYEVRLQGRLMPRWAAWFDGLTLTAHDDGTTTLRGPVADQAALHGVLQRLRDLGVPLVSVARVLPAPGGTDPGSPPPGSPARQPHHTTGEPT